METLLSSKADSQDALTHMLVFCTSVSAAQQWQLHKLLADQIL